MVKVDTKGLGRRTRRPCWLLRLSQALLSPMRAALVLEALAQPIAQANVEISAVDAVATTMVAAAATQAVRSRLADQTIRGMGANVDRLEARVITSHRRMTLDEVRQRCPGRFIREP